MNPNTAATAAPQRLTRLPLFRELDPWVLARICGELGEIDARRGTVIFRRGEAGRGWYLLQQGEVKLVLPSSQGGERIVEVVEPGGSFGASSALLDRPHRLSAVAMTDARLSVIPRASLLSELARTPALARSLVESLSHRLQHLVGALENCMTRSGTERVIDYLLGLTAADVADGAAAVVLGAKKGTIASQLNLTQEHFSRILRSLATQGLIDVKGRSIRIRDVGRLRARGRDLRQPSRKRPRRDTEAHEAS
jgi:CRP-like cAMP-binding protein